MWDGGSQIRMRADGLSWAGLSWKGRDGICCPYLVIVLTSHDVGEGDLSLEHLPAMHELHQQVAHGLESHPLGWLDVRED